MSAPLTPAGESAVADIAARYRVSEGAVRTLLDAVIRGGGAMAQFSHPELGGSGQWMRGGMTMVGDMFNPGLQATVSGICSELSATLASGGVLVKAPDPGAGSAFGGFGGQAWWPDGLGRPSSSGGQNDASYAYFPGPRRLAIRRGGAITLYDTLDHAISGVQQQQGGRGSLEFSSQHGTFTVDTLPVVSGGTPASAAPDRAADAPSGGSSPVVTPPPAPVAAPPVVPVASPAAVVPPPAPTPPPAPAQSGVVTSAAEIGAAIETLASLRDKGFVTEAEFAAKKAELLARL